MMLASRGLFFAFALSWTASASAFCRTTTCNNNVSCAENPADCCVLDASGCDTNGLPISWPTSCVSYSTQQDGSSLRSITKEQLRTALEASYQEWLSVDCDGSSLSIAIEDRGYASCGLPEFNEGKKDSNANVWMFRDDEAISGNGAQNQNRQVDASALAIAIVSFDFKTAEIVDVDVELNSPLADFTVSDDPATTDIDLQSVVTHETGHFLGLDHSLVDGATMLPGYLPGHLEPRTLSPDDQAGICAVYPPNRVIASDNQTCEPRGKYSGDCNKEGCGCSVVGSDQGRAPYALWLFALGAAAALRRRMKSRRLV